MVWPRYKLTMGKMTMVNLNKFSFKENNYAIYIVNDICVLLWLSGPFDPYDLYRLHILWNTRGMGHMGQIGQICVSCILQIVIAIQFTHTHTHTLNIYQHEIRDRFSYLRGFARTLCPIVTKLVSWLDINQANDETLLQKHINVISNT